MSERDYYEILGLRFDADGTAVNRTYWLLARKYQAQADSDPRAHHMLDELNEAYGVLGTPVLREAYDAAHPELAHADPEQQTGWDGLTVASAGAFAVGAQVPARPRGTLQIGAAAPYGAVALLGAIGAGGGLWAGSSLLAVLGAGGAILLGAAYARHNETAPWHGAVITRADPGVDATATPRADARGSVDEPLSASIVRRRDASADELRLSTASMVGRWRDTVAAGANRERGDAGHGPDPTLVDIFRSEEELEAQSEPLSAVLDVLRGSRHSV